MSGQIVIYNGSMLLDGGAVAMDNRCCCCDGCKFECGLSGTTYQWQQLEANCAAYYQCLTPSSPCNAGTLGDIYCGDCVPWALWAKQQQHNNQKGFTYPS